MNAAQRGGVAWRLVAVLAIAAGLVAGLGAQQKAAQPVARSADALLGAAASVASGLRLLILHGSRARNDARPDSD